MAQQMHKKSQIFHKAYARLAWIRRRSAAARSVHKVRKKAFFFRRDLHLRTVALKSRHYSDCDMMTQFDPGPAYYLQVCALFCRTMHGQDVKQRRSISP